MMRALVLLAVATTGLAGPVSRAADGAGHYDAVAPHHVEIEQLPASEGRPRYPSLARRDSEPLRLRGLDETLRAADDDPISKAHSPTEFLRNTAYAGTVSVGGQEFKMILDTGSSDTWVVTSSFQCYDDFGRRATVSYRPASLSSDGK